MGHAFVVCNTANSRVDRMKFITLTIGDRAFPIAAAKTWDSLLVEVTSSLDQYQPSNLNLKLTCFLCPFQIFDCKVTEVQFCIIHLKLNVCMYVCMYCLQCFDTVG